MAGAKRPQALVGLLLLALVGCTSPAGSDRDGPAVPDSRVRGVGPPETGAYLGTHFSGSLRDRPGAIEDLEQDLGRPVAIDHVYHRFDASFPTSYDRWTVAEGRLLFLSWSCRTRSGVVRWDEITDGSLDPLIDARAEAVAALGVPVLMSFCHEPAAYFGAGRAGTVPDYRAAWRHLVERFAAAGAPVSWVWTLTAHAFREDDAEDLYPGSDLVDWVGVDGYVNVDCSWLDVPWRTWTETFDAAHQFADQHDKPLVVAEFSLREDPADPQRKAEWLAGSVAEMELMPRLGAVVGFNSVEPCSDYVASTPEAVAGLREMALSDFLSPRPAG